MTDPVTQIQLVPIPATIEEELTILLTNPETDPTIRIMCSMLLNNIPVDISTMLRSTINDPSSDYNFDTTTSVWKTYNKRYRVSQEFTDLITSLNLLPIPIQSSNSKKQVLKGLEKKTYPRFSLYSITKTSRLFKNTTGHNYTEYQRNIKPKPVPEPEQVTEATATA